MRTRTAILIDLINDHRDEVLAAVRATPDWSIAANTFDALFQRMANPADILWTNDTITKLRDVYHSARDDDKECKNITERTVKAMPTKLANDTKLIFLQIANACRIFNAAHKVNFDPVELPEDYPEIHMKPAKKRGSLTYAHDMPTLYQKISLTFDYWVPKVLAWTTELREKGLTEWKGERSFEHESCTDFLRIALLFLSDPEKNLPIAKQDVRRVLLEDFFGEEFRWIKKSAKREDILPNSVRLQTHLAKLPMETGMVIPNEAWNRVFGLKSIKSSLS